MLNQPLVSVTIPVYNAEKYLRETIESVLNQTYKNFELILVNDASTDSSKELILSFSDPRISYYENPANMGIVKTRNNCVHYAKGKYIAILDNDDISLPIRLEKEVEFLESNPEYGLCGSFYDVIDSNGNFTVRIEVPCTSYDINTYLIFNNCFCHSSVMIRSELMKENKFVESYELMEDYDLVYRLSGKTKMANLPVYTTKYRVHGKNQSTKKAGEMLSLRKRMDARILNDLKIPFNESELIIHSNFVNSTYSYFRSGTQLKQLEEWLLKLYNILDSRKRYDSEIIARIFIKRWILLFYFTRRVSFRFFYSGLFWNFKSRYIKYLIEFINDRFSKKFKVA
jgi:glycosyltransferase involved in cell wall biosynthesis